MGTETLSNVFGELGTSTTRVKLNNPLMGTETLLWSKLHTDFIKSTVKLNDPLMGTETRIHQGISPKELLYS